MPVKNRFSITDVAKSVGVTSRTIMRWEKAGKIRKSKRDWRGWRFYTKEEIEDIKRFYDTTYEYSDHEGVIVHSSSATAQAIKAAVSFIFTSIALFAPLHYAISAAEANNANTVDVITTPQDPNAQKQHSNNTPINNTKLAPKHAQVSGIKETPKTVDVDLSRLPVQGTVGDKLESPLTYTLGSDDVIAIDVRRHPEFSGQYTINSEGKIEYKYVGDINVAGLTKDELKLRLNTLLSDYLVQPDIDVQIVSYLSKVFYVVGEVSKPGKFYMRGNSVNIREALVQAGLPTLSAAMRRSRLITPDKRGKDNFKDVDVYKLLYEGDLRQDLVMKPSDVLYIPATVLAKILHVIMPVSDTANSIRNVGGPAVSAAAGAAF